MGSVAKYLRLTTLTTDFTFLSLLKSFFSHNVTDRKMEPNLCCKWWRNAQKYFCPFGPFLLAWGQFHKTFGIRKLQICCYGQILTINLLINCKNSVIYGKMAVNYEELVLWNRPLACLCIFVHQLSHGITDQPLNIRCTSQKNGMSGKICYPPFHAFYERNS